AAIFVAIAAIFIRDFVKKHGRKKTAVKNSDNVNKNKRYVKKYVKANGEAPAIAEGDVDESLLSDTPAATEDVATVESAEQPEAQVEEAVESEAQAEQTEQTEEAKPEGEQSEDNQTGDGEDK
ncbi:MAG: hypothetical protein K2N17_00500, partial [Clostridia bacterium]|nr:hypothetical protein [Clostridia bacterium]